MCEIPVKSMSEVENVKFLQSVAVLDGDTCQNKYFEEVQNDVGVWLDRSMSCRGSEAVPRDLVLDSSSNTLGESGIRRDINMDKLMKMSLN